MRIDAMIAGVQKGGTTSLLRYLGELDGVVAQSSLEFPFFAIDANYELGIERAFERWFPPDDGFHLAKSVGVAYLPWARQRLQQHNPHCKIVVCLREPAARAHSAYWYLRKTGQESLSTFEDALAAEDQRMVDFKVNHHFAYVDRGRYHSQIDELCTLFGRDNVHLVATEALRRDPTTEVRNVAAFLGLAVPAEFVVAPHSLNAASAVRSATLARSLHGHDVNRVLQIVRRTVARSALARSAVADAVGAVNRNNSFEVPPLAPSTRAQLLDAFAGSNRLLAADFGFDPAYWEAVP